MEEEILNDDGSSYVVSFLTSKPVEKGSLLDLLDIKKEVELSFLYDKSKLQDSYCFRLQRRAALLTKYILDPKGGIDRENLQKVIALLEKESFIFYPTGMQDKAALAHMLFVLRKVQDDKSFQKLFQKFQPPLCHAWAEELVLCSVGDFQSVKPTQLDVKGAVFSALLTSLRQNVGSCFATAPAVLIQQEQIEKLLEDLYELLMTGKLKRVVAGVEKSVPLSPSSGGGDLYRVVSLEEGTTLSPGLFAAFGVTGLLSHEGNLRSLLLPILKSQRSMRVIDLIRSIFLVHFDLTEEDIRLHKETNRAFLKSKEFIAGIKVGGASKKHQSCDAMLSLEKKAHSAFKSTVDHPLLKAWEFTLASLAESKMDFSRYNLYSSLGLNSDEKGGIGEVIYNALQGQMNLDRQKLEQYDLDYQVAYDQVRVAESQLKRASSESEARRLQAEFTTRVYHMRTCLELRDTLYANTTQYSTFYTSLFKEYDAKFPEYFQEIYDADLRDVSSSEYEDSAAGFRLVYKHGRDNAYLWTMVYNSEEYIDFLVDFFLLTEPQIAASFDWEFAPKVLSEVTSLVISHIRTPEFLASALGRMKKIHGERGDTGKPWAYTSGGSMQTLLQTYYRREFRITEESKKVESVTDLVVFIIDTLKNTPIAFEDKKLLMSSPSHAFTLIPSLEFLKSGWQDDLFTYTWVRDCVILPQKSFFEAITLSASEQAFLVEEFGKKLPSQLAHLLQKISFLPVQTLVDFRDTVLEAFSKLLLQDELDSFLYETIPLVSGYNWKNFVKSLLSDLETPKLDSLLDNYPDYFCDFLSAKKIKEIAKSFYLLTQNTVSFTFDLHEVISKKAEEVKLAPPPPLYFADTNWFQFHFAFLVSPGTGEFELWRLEPSSGKGIPMSSWKKWLSEKNSSSWNICSRPFEYR